MSYDNRFKSFQARNYVGHVLLLIMHACLHVNAARHPTVSLAGSLTGLQVMHFLPDWWSFSFLSLAPRKPLWTVSRSVSLCLCGCFPCTACRPLYVCTCLSASFPERTHSPSRPCQAVSGCTQFTAGGYSCHLLSEHLSSHLPSSPVLSFLSLTHLHFSCNTGELCHLIQHPVIHPGAALYSKSGSEGELLSHSWQ